MQRPRHILSALIINVTWWMSWSGDVQGLMGDVVMGKIWHREFWHSCPGATIVETHLRTLAHPGLIHKSLTELCCWALLFYLTSPNIYVMDKNYYLCTTNWLTRWMYFTRKEINCLLFVIKELLWKYWFLKPHSAEENCRLSLFILMDNKDQWVRWECT